MTLKELESVVVSTATGPELHMTHVFIEEDAADEWVDAYLTKRVSDTDPIFTIYGSCNASTYLKDSWLEAKVYSLIPVDRNIIAVVLARDNFEE